MSFATSIPEAVVNLVVGFLLPLLLPTVGGDRQAASVLALDLLASYNPQGPRELSLAGEAIAHSLKALALLARSAEPDIAAEKLENSLKWACSLSRSSHQAQRRLDALQRARQQTLKAAAEAEAIETAPTTIDAAPPKPVAGPRELAAASPESVSAPIIAIPRAADETAPPPDLAQAQAALFLAEQQLVLMKARWKGAPQPHTQAGQQIQAQQRIVNTARLQLEQARRNQAEPRPTAA
jgi:hypothetical protein